MTDGGEIAGAAGAVIVIKTLLEKTSIYEDAFRPGLKAFGNTSKPAGAALGRAVSKVARAAESATDETIEVLSSGYGLVKGWLADKLAEKLEGTPEGRIVPPHPIIAVPTIDALSYTASEPTLSEMYLNLLATAMDLETVLKAHPRFVEIIRQITPDEARIIKAIAARGDFDMLSFYPEGEDKARIEADPTLPVQYSSILAYDSGCDFTSLGGVYAENLSSLGVLDLWGPPPGTIYYTVDDRTPEDRSKLAEWIVEGGGEPRMKAQSGGRVKLTSLGKRFVEACVRPTERSSEGGWSVTWD